MHGKMCLRPFSRKLEIELIHNSCKVSLAQRQDWKRNQTSSLLEESKSQLWANSVQTFTFHCGAEKFYLCVDANECNKYLKIAYYTTCRWRCCRGIWLMPNILSVLWSNSRVLAVALREAEHTFFCILNSPLGSHCFLQALPGLCLVHSGSMEKKQQIFEGMESIGI